MPAYRRVASCLKKIFRSRRVSVAVRRMRRRLCGLLLASMPLLWMIPDSYRPPAQQAPTCPSVFIRRRGSCAVWASGYLSRSNCRHCQHCWSIHLCHWLHGMSSASSPAGAAGGNHADDVPKEFDRLIDFLEQHDNDLTDAACACAPVVGEILETLRALPGVRLVRMSGSGPTCFALFSTRDELANSRAKAQGQTGQTGGSNPPRSVSVKTISARFQCARPMQNATASSNADLISDGGTSASASVAIAP